jgi:hypothetical protein
MSPEIFESYEWRIKRDIVTGDFISNYTLSKFIFHFISLCSAWAIRRTICHFRLIIPQSHTRNETKTTYKQLCLRREVGEYRISFWLLQLTKYQVNMRNYDEKSNTATAIVWLNIISSYHIRGNSIDNLASLITYLNDLCEGRKG